MRWPTVVPSPPAGFERAATSRSPRLSVIIAAYQAAAFITDAIESVLAQTVPPHEIVVCDDGSTDNIEDALAPYRDELRLLRQANQGEARAKNAAAAAATGEFVVILDSDDVWLPERLEAIGALAGERPDLDLITTDALFEVDGETRGHFYSKERPFPAEHQARAIFERAFVMPHPAVRRARWLELGGFETAMQPAADWHFYIRLALTGSKFGLVDAPLARYRLRPGSMASDRPNALRARVNVLDDLLAAGVVPPHLLDTAEIERSRHLRRALLAEAEAAIRSGAPDARRRAMALARGPAVATPTRLKALAAAISPRLAGRTLARAPSRRLERSDA